MITREKAIEILNREKNYEDRLVENIIHFCSISLNEISDLDKEQKIEIESNLNLIRDESTKHSRMFEGLINFILENEKNKY